MDLSINKSNAINNEITFKGLEGAYAKDSTPVFKFIAPAHTKDEAVRLELGYTKKDPVTGRYLPPEKVLVYNFNSDDTFELPQEIARKASSGFAYRYKIVNKKTKETRYEIDPYKEINVKGNGKPNSDKMNIIEQGRMYGISPKGGTMRHSFLDSDVILNNGDYKKNREFIRSHFNKLGGNLAGLLYMLEKGGDELDPYRYLMTTPDIGVDKVSSHRYWPSNQYQCQDLETFKKFNLELFKRGKAYIADGAFTSQGIQSPLVQHVLKWGEKSPFYHMLKVDGKVGLGILPDVSEPDGVDPYEHIGVRLVNSKDAENYDKTKPTYIQFYDDRLLSEKAQQDGQLHFDPDKELDDHYDIVSHQDSVQPYAFELSSSDYDAKTAIFSKKSSKAVLLKDIAKEYGGFQDYLTFKNFKITEKNKASGASCWDGNVDIIKMNLSNPTSEKANIDGFFAAREYIHGVASYWTELIQSHLILEAAKLDDKDRASLVKSNNITDKRLEEIKESIQIETGKEGSFKSLVLQQNKTAQDFVADFPLQSLETSEELSAIFAQPQFREEFKTDETVKKLASIVENTIVSAIPDNLKQNAEYKAYALKMYSVDVLRYVLAGALKSDAVKNGEINLSELKKVTLKSLEKSPSDSPEQERKYVISKLNNGIPNISTTSLSTKIAKELKGISLEDFKLSEAIVLQGKGGLNWRFDAAKDVGDLDAVADEAVTFEDVWYGVGNIPGVQDFWAEYVRRIKESHPAAYVINEVTTLDELIKADGGKYTPEEMARSKSDFNSKLTINYARLAEAERAKKIQKTTEDFKKEGKSQAELEKAIEAIKNTPDSELVGYEQDTRYTVQVDFLNMTNSTTTSEYDKGFNKFSAIAGVDPEHGENKASNAGDLKELKGAFESLDKYYQPDSARFAHGFTENHDKPRVLHTLPLDMSIFLAGNEKNPKGLADMNLGVQRRILKVTGLEDKEHVQAYEKDHINDKEFLKNNPAPLTKQERTVLNRLNPMAAAVALAMTDKVIDKDPEFNKPEIKKALAELATGKKPDGNIMSKKRAESFAVKPYEITIADILERSGLYKGPDGETDKDLLAQKTLEFHKKFLGDSMKYYERIWQVMNAFEGTPTLFAGAEYAQTGYETRSKNVYLGIRNQILHGVQDLDGVYKDHYNRIHRTAKMYQLDGLSALREGTATSLKMTICESEYDKELKALADEYNKAQDIKRDKGEETVYVDQGKLNWFVELMYTYTTGYLGLNSSQAIGNAVDNVFASSENIAQFCTIGNAIYIPKNDGDKERFTSTKNQIKKLVLTKFATKDAGKGLQIWPIYRKDSTGSQVVSVVTNLGLPQGKSSFESKAVEKIEQKVEFIELKDNNGRCPFEDGTWLKRVDDPNPRFTYKVENGKIYKYTLDGKKAGDIILNDTVTTFYYDKKRNN